MNLIICSENCTNQKDGYCQMEGHSQITNALASPCCYFSEAKTQNTPASFKSQQATKKRHGGNGI